MQANLEQGIKQMVVFEEKTIENTEKGKNVAEGTTPMKRKSLMTKRRNEIIFLCFIFAFPILHKLVFYIGKNFQSILLSFQAYDRESQSYYLIGFDNFKNVFYDLTHSTVLKTCMKNTLYLYLMETFISIPISLFCSFFIIKKVPGHGALKIIFFLPSMVSSVTMVLAFKYFCEYAVPDIASRWFNVTNFPLILNEYPYAYPMMLLYSLWVGFASGIVLYLGTMSKVPDGVTDAAMIDGVSVLGEFWHVIMPTVYPTLSVFLITGFVAIFTGSGPIYTFYKDSAPQYCYTTGYYLFTRVVGQNSSAADYPYAASIGMLITLIATPLTFLLKYTLEHIGPREE